MKKINDPPNSFVMQFHITEKCNIRCKHCYQDTYNMPEMDLSKLQDIVDQYSFLINKWKIPHQRARIQITGGEPFLRKDFFLFLEYVSKFSNLFNWIILSNGLLITNKIAKKLKELKINSFQISLEGTKKTNDEIRGKGTFNKVLETIVILKKASIPVNVSLTLSKINDEEIEKLAEILNPLGVYSLNVRRIVPSGINVIENIKLIHEPYELQKVYQKIENINKKMKEKNNNIKINGGCENALYNDEISSPALMSKANCAITRGAIITVLPNGNVMACRRIPIILGNLKEKSLYDIYNSKQYIFLREKKDVPLECCFCVNVNACYGGAKCVTYALTRKTAPDVQCWKLFDSLDESINYIKKPDLMKKLSLCIKNFKK